MNRSECFKVGYISKTHGLKGEVTAIFENEIEWDGLTSLFLELKGKDVPYFVEKIAGTGSRPIIKFEGINSIDEASPLKGGSIYVLKSLRPKLNRGEFYDDEIIGYEVHDKITGTLGLVKEVQSQGGNRLLHIAHGQKEILVPVNAPFIKTINKTKRLIQVELPEGFFEF